MRSRPRAPRSDPVVVGREGGLDLGLFQGFRGGVPFDRSEPPQIRQRDNGGCLSAEVDDFIRLGTPSRLRSHTTTIPAIGGQLPVVAPAGSLTLTRRIGWQLSGAPSLTISST